MRVPGWVRRKKLATGIYVVVINGEEFGIATLDDEDKVWSWSAFPEGWEFGGETTTLSAAIEELYSAYQELHPSR